MSENVVTPNRRGVKKETNKTDKKWYERLLNIKEWKRKNKIIAAVLLILSLLGIVFVAIPYFRSSQPLSFMIVGTDSDTYREQEYSGRKPHRTDAIMVATFNPKTYNVEITSIPRDTAVDYACEVQDMGYKIRGPINEVYEASGRDIGCLQQTVSNFLNVPIDYYALLDLSQLEHIIDEIGGISLQVHAQDGSFCQVTTNVERKYCFYDGEVEEMNGEEAVTYARFRKDSERDYGRGRRQQQVISAMLSKIVSEKKFGLGVITKIAASIQTNVSPVIMARYLDYFKNMNKVGKMLLGESTIKKSVLPDKAWLQLFSRVGLDSTTVSKDTINQALELARANPSYTAAPLQLFFSNHQFENGTYAGFYVADDQQRYDISNSLRKNLGLSEQTPPEYENEFGRASLLTDEEAFFGEEYPEPNYDYLPDENEKETTVTEEVTPTNNRPVISGVDTYQIKVGEAFNHQLVATDAEDGNVAVYVVSSNLDTSQPGQYTVTYQAKDSQGNVSDPYIVYVSVIANQQSNPNTIDASKILFDSDNNPYYKDENGKCYNVTANTDGTYTLGGALDACPA